MYLALQRLIHLIFQIDLIKLTISISSCYFFIGQPSLKQVDQ